MSSNPIIIQLGSNVGDRNAHLLTAKDHLARCSTIERSSSTFETEAWGLQEQSSFYNQLIEINTSLNPYALLKQCLSIETSMGRTREIAWGPRIIDIDIILYRNKIIFSPELSIPHEFYRERRFILEPLAERWGTTVDPITKKNSLELLEQCIDNSKVVRI